MLLVLVEVACWASPAVPHSSVAKRENRIVIPSTLKGSLDSNKALKDALITLVCTDSSKMKAHMSRVVLQRNRRRPYGV